MKNGPVQLSRQLRRVSIAMGYALARFYRLCCRIRCTGIGVSPIPGLLTCNISFRAGGSGRAYHLPFLLKTQLKHHRNKEMTPPCAISLVSLGDTQGCAA